MQLRSGRRLTIAAVVAVAAIASLGFLIRLSTGSRPAPDFTLMAADGTAFRLSQQRGHTVVLAFGYTHCPDVCPMTLAALARAKRDLGAGAAALEVAFITVDPARDTPAVMRRYVRLFDPSFVGLSGTSAQLDAVYAAYRIYHQQLPGNGATSNYAVAHSSDLTIIGPDGRLRATVDADDSPHRLAAELQRTRS